MRYLLLTGFRKNLLAVLLLLLIAAGCKTVSLYDQYAYTQTTSAKVDAMNLMDMATEDYSAHTQDVKQVMTTMDKLYEYERNRKNDNETSIQLWGKLRDTSGHLFYGFIKLWKKDGKLGKGFIDESKVEVGEAFDIIAQFESKKRKSK